MKKLALLLVLAFCSTPVFATEEEFTVEEFWEVINTTHISAASCLDNIEAIEKTKSREQLMEIVGQVDIFCSRVIYGSEVIFQNPKLVAAVDKQTTGTPRVLDEIAVTERVIQKFISVTGFKLFPLMEHTFKTIDKEAKSKIKV